MCRIDRTVETCEKDPMTFRWNVPRRTTIKVRCAASVSKGRSSERSLYKRNPIVSACNIDRSRYFQRTECVHWTRTTAARPAPGVQAQSGYRSIQPTENQFGLVITWRRYQRLSFGCVYPLVTIILRREMFAFAFLAFCLFSSV